MSKNKTFYITTPIYYPSGNLHIGHVYTTTLAWTLKNYKTLMGFDAKFLTGADEHGQKIELKAKEAGLEPQKYVDDMTDIFKRLWKKLEIEYDYYSRTTNPKHEKAVSNMFSRLLKEGVIYKDKYKGLYSVQDEEFFTPLQASKGEDGKFYHPISGHPLQEVEEESYFFNMSSQQQGLIDHYNENDIFIIPQKIVKELRANFIDKGLEDLSVTRTSFDWGIPVKEDPEHVIYVWIDALTNYITALGYETDDDTDFKKYWENGDEIVHIVGKEITRFHCIYWPIILHSLGLKQPDTILSHGWIITPEGKMSKSKGNVVDPNELIDKYGAEQVKYYFSSQINMGQDGIFDEEALRNVLNADLANNYGNLLSRTVAIVKQNFDGAVKFTPNTNDLDIEMYEKIEKSVKIYQKEFDAYHINKALGVATKLSRSLNSYIEKTTPWALKDDLPRLEKVLNTLLNGIYAVTTMLSVVCPNKANQALKSLGIKGISFEQLLDYNKFDNVTVEKNEPLFERIKA